VAQHWAGRVLDDLGALLLADDDTARQLARFGRLPLVVDDVGQRGGDSPLASASNDNDVNDDDGNAMNTRVLLTRYEDTVADTDGTRRAIYRWLRLGFYHAISFQF
jgi:hypothetical protein